MLCAVGHTPHRTAAERAEPFTSAAEQTALLPQSPVETSAAGARTTVVSAACPRRSPCRAVVSATGCGRVPVQSTGRLRQWPPVRVPTDTAVTHPAVSASGHGGRPQAALRKSRDNCNKPGRSAD